MHLLKSSTAGTYKPSFFLLTIDAKDVLTPLSTARERENHLLLMPAECEQWGNVLATGRAVAVVFYC
jgi:hypothetical protein